MSNVPPEMRSLVPENRYTRREFVVTALGAGFAAAVQPVMAQQVIATDTKGLTVGEVKVPVSDGTIPAYRAQPAAGDTHPVVLVVQEIFGVHEYIKDVCRRLAKVGYLAIAPELYARQGDVSKMTSIPEILEKVVSKVPDAQVMADLDACAAWAKDHGGEVGRLAITGFCWGGRIVWLYAAHNPDLKAGAAWYGRLEGESTPNTPKHPLQIAKELKAPVLGLYGGKDEGIPLESVERMREALKGSNSDIRVYPDAPHGFHADYRPSYRKQLAEGGWQRMLWWFKNSGVTAAKAQ